MKLMVCLFGLLLLPIATSADTLQLTNNSSLNGKVSYADDHFYVEAKFSTGIKRFDVPRDAVVKDKINDLDYNQGVPGSGITAYEMPANYWVKVNAAAHKRAKSDGANNLEAASLSMSGSILGGRQSATSYDGQDFLTLRDPGANVKGSLIEMTQKEVVIRLKGQRNDTRYKRNDVQSVTVGR